MPGAIYERTKIKLLSSAALLILFFLISVNWSILIDAMFYCLRSLSELNAENNFSTMKTLKNYPKLTNLNTDVFCHISKLHRTRKQDNTCVCAVNFLNICLQSTCSRALGYKNGQGRKLSLSLWILKVNDMGY